MSYSVGLHNGRHNKHVDFIEDVSITSVEVAEEWDDEILQKTSELGIMKDGISSTKLTQSKYVLEVLLFL